MLALAGQQHARPPGPLALSAEHTAEQWPDGHAHEVRMAHRWGQTGGPRAMPGRQQARLCSEQAGHAAAGCRLAPVTAGRGRLGRAPAVCCAAPAARSPGCPWRPCPSTWPGNNHIPEHNHKDYKKNPHGMLCGLPKQGESTAKARQAEGARRARAPAGMRGSVALSSTEARSVAHPAMPWPVCHHADTHARHGALARPGGRGRRRGRGPGAAPDLIRDLAAEKVRVLLAQRVEVQRDLGIHAAADVVVHRPGALRAPRVRARRNTSLLEPPLRQSGPRLLFATPPHQGTPRLLLITPLHSVPPVQTAALLCDGERICRQHPGAPQVHHRSSAGRRRHCSTASTVPATQARRWLSRAVTRHGHLLVLAAAQRPRLARAQHVRCGGRTVSSALWPLRGSASPALPRSRALPFPLDDSACVAAICSQEQQRFQQPALAAVRADETDAYIMPQAPRSNNSAFAQPVQCWRPRTFCHRLADHLPGARRCPALARQAARAIRDTAAQPFHTRRPRVLKNCQARRQRCACRRSEVAQHRPQSNGRDMPALRGPRAAAQPAAPGRTSGRAGRGPRAPGRAARRAARPRAARACPRPSPGSAPGRCLRAHMHSATPACDLLPGLRRARRRAQPFEPCP